MAERILIDHGSLESAKQQVASWRVPTSVKREMASFLDALAMGKVNRGKRISPRRQVKYLYALRTPLEFLAKPTARLTVADIESLERSLQSGRLRSRLTNKPFAAGTQVDMRILLRIFLRWRLGDAKAEELAGWLDVRSRLRTPNFLTEAEVETLYRACRDARQRFLIAVLFDTGARAEEFHNIRFEDVFMPGEKEQYLRITLKAEYSKTQGRTVALYWKRSVEAVRDYLQERTKDGVQPTTPVFSGNYSAMRKLLQRLGQRVLRKSLPYHLLRHSSATYYATKLNRQELCYRYGWKFSSNMPDVYISRAGMETKQLDERFAQTELNAVKSELVEMEQARCIDKERIRQLESGMAAMGQNLKAVAQVLKLNPNVKEIQTGMSRQREPSTKSII